MKNEFNFVNILDWKKMNQYLSQIYTLIINIDHDVPQDIYRYIMLIIYNFTRKKVFIGYHNTCILTNSHSYACGKNKLNHLMLKLINIDYIKNIVYGKHFITLLYNNGKVYMCGDFANKSEKITFIIEDIDNIFAGEFYCCYLARNGELFIQGSNLPSHIGRFVVSRQLYYLAAPVKLDIRNVKDMLCSRNKAILLLNNKIVIDWDRKHIIDTNSISGYKDCVDTVNDRTILVTSDDTVVKLRYEEQAYIIYKSNNIKMSACTKLATFILTHDGNLYSYGYRCSELGLGYHPDYQSLANFEKVNLPPVDSLYCGENHVIAITIQGDIYGWGNNHQSQLGISFKVQHEPLKLVL